MTHGHAVLFTYWMTVRFWLICKLIDDVSLLRWRRRSYKTTNRKEM